MVNIDKMDLVLQGPWDSESGYIVETYLSLPFVNSILISTWERENIVVGPDQKNFLSSLKEGRVRILYSTKPSSPGTDNRNLQILSSKIGMENVTTGFSAKLRTDQRYQRDSMLHMFNYMKNCYNLDNQIFVAGIYPNLLFHPRDHTFWGRTEDLKNLFSVDLEYNGFADKVNVPKEELGQFYPFFTRSETYIGVRYCKQFDPSIQTFIDYPEKYLHDKCDNWAEAYEVSKRITNRAFRSFPRTGIDLEWKRKGWVKYPYEAQWRSGERWAEDL